MLIALDYDNTYTADPYFWNWFLDIAKLSNHDVIIATMRGPEIDRITEHEFDVPVHYCDGFPKRKELANRGILPDIWIDDHPEGIYLGSVFTPEQLEEWRNNGRK